jgi:hypothetical protein
MMSDLLKNLAVRELASQRTVSLFKDQEELIDKLNEKYGINIKFAKLVREGVDLALKQIEQQLEDNKE